MDLLDTKKYIYELQDKNKSLYDENNKLKKENDELFRENLDLQNKITEMNTATYIFNTLGGISLILCSIPVALNYLASHNIYLF